MTDDGSTSKWLGGQCNTTDNQGELCVPAMLGYTTKSGVSVNSNLLSLVTELDVKSRGVSIGSSNFPFLSLFENLKKFWYTLNSKGPHPVDLFFSPETQKIAEILIWSYAVGELRLKCAYEIRFCLNNTLDSLKIYEDRGYRDFEMTGLNITMSESFKFPPIKELRVDFIANSGGHERSTANNQGRQLSEPEHTLRINSPLFEGVKINDVIIEYPFLNHIIPIVDLSGAEITNKISVSTYDITRHTSQRHARAEICEFMQDSNLDVPVIYRRDKGGTHTCAIRDTYLTQVYANCPYAESILTSESASMSTDSEGKITLRLQELSLSSLSKILKGSESVPVIIYTMYLTISEDFKPLSIEPPRTAATTIYYFEVRSSSGQPEMVYNTGNWNIRHIRFDSKPDALFVSLAASCTMKKLGMIKNEASSGNDNALPSLLYNWFPALDRVISKYDGQPPSMLVARATRAVEDLHSYHKIITTSTNKVPVLSLDIMGDSITLLSKLGRDTMQKRREFEIIWKADSMRDLIISSVSKLSKDMKQNYIKTAHRVTSNSEDVKITLLEDSKRKSMSLAQIEEQKVEAFKLQLSKQEELINRSMELYEKHKEAVERETVNFEKGMKETTAMAAAEVAAEAVGQIFSFFSGGFNPAKMLRAASKVKKLTAMLKKLTAVFKKLNELMKKGALFSSLAKSFKNKMKRVKEAFKTWHKNRKGRWEKKFSDLNRRFDRLPVKDVGKASKWGERLKN